MKDNPFIARCSIILFLCSILVPPLLYIFALNSPGSESIIVFFFFTSLILSFIFAILSREIAISKISLFGSPFLAILLSGLVIFTIHRSNELQKESQALAKAKFEEAKMKAEQARQRAEQGAAANP